MRIKEIRYLKLILILLYIAFIFWFCVFSRNFSAYDVRPPGWSFYNMWNYWWESFLLVQTIGNVLLYVPLGVLLVLYKQDISFKLVVSVGAVVCLSVELLQYTLSCGTFDFDDVINNIAGTIVGCEVIKSVGNKRVSLRLVAVIAAYLILAVRVMWISNRRI